MSDAGKPLKNTHNIKAALDGIFHQRTDGAKAKIDIPQKQYGNHIPEDVFSAVDLSDLVVADISHRSPNVMYELAFAHALGIPTILIDMPDAQPSPAAGRKKKASASPPPAKRKIFYLNQERTLLPRTRSKQAVARELKPLIDGWLKGESVLGRDPLTRFYDIPLVDVSAVAGIAQGYAENFIAPLIGAIQKSIEQSHEGKRLARPIAVVVVLPESLDNLEEEELSVRNELEPAFGASAVCKGLDVSTPKGKRSVPYYVDGVFIDIPRTLIHLRRSRRVERLPSRADRDTMERKLIDAFSRSLLNRAENMKDISVKRLRIVKRAELIGTIRDLSSPAPDGNPTR